MFKAFWKKMKPRLGFAKLNGDKRGDFPEVVHALCNRYLDSVNF